MEIKDLQPRQGKVDVLVEVVEVGEAREFEKFGKTGRVANATVKDASGEIALTLWNDDIDKVKVGNKVQITNGYVNEWQGEKQLTTGKFGKLEVIESENAPTEQKKDAGIEDEHYEPKEPKKESFDDVPVSDEEFIED